ncbi:MAG: LysR family transcriptional regulator [Pseudomonadota bacterium]
MDIALAKTFLTVAETGSFIDAGRRMNLTQSTVSSRIKNLEDALGQALFQRSKLGAELTTAGEQFRRHALTLVRVWQHAQFEVGLSSYHRDHLAVGAPEALWGGFLLPWVSWMRAHIPDIAVTARAETSSDLTMRMLEGTLDLAVTYRPIQQSGVVSEHLFDDVFVLVTSAKPGTRRNAIEHVTLDWGPDVQESEAGGDPSFTNTGLSLELGANGLTYMLDNPCVGYVPMRLARAHMKRRRLRKAPRARAIAHPVFMSYPEVRDEDAYDPILDALRSAADDAGR